MTSAFNCDLQSKQMAAFSHQRHPDGPIQAPLSAVILSKAKGLTYHLTEHPTQYLTQHLTQYPTQHKGP